MDTNEQLNTKYGRSKFNSAYKDQFLQEISSCVRETDFLVNPQSNEMGYSSGKFKENDSAHENIPQESDDIYHRRQSQIPKRPKLQTATQKKSLIPTTNRHSKKSNRKSDFGPSVNINSDDNQNSPEKSTIVPLADDDLAHIFDFSASNISNDDSSASPSPKKYKSQKIRSKSPGPMLTSNNKKQFTERKNVIRSKSPSSLRRKTRKTGKNISNSPKKSRLQKNEDDFSDDNNQFQEERAYRTNPSLKEVLYEENEENNFETYSTPQHLNGAHKLYATLNDNDNAIRNSTMGSSHRYKSPEKVISTDSENSPRHVPHSPFDVSYNSPSQSPIRSKKSSRTAGNLMKRKKSPKAKKKSTKKKEHTPKKEIITKNSEDEEYDYNNKDEHKLTDLDIQNIKSGWTAPTINSSSSSPLQNISSNRLVSNHDDNQNMDLNQSEDSPIRKSFEKLRSSDNEESGHDDKLISFSNIKEEEVPENPPVKQNSDFDLISFSPMRPVNNNRANLENFSDNGEIDDNANPMPLINNQNDESQENKLVANPEYLVNENSDNSNEENENSSAKDKHNSKSDLLNFSELEVKTSPKGKPDLDVIDQIINNNNYEQEIVVNNEIDQKAKNQNEDNLISFSIIQDPPVEDNLNDNNENADNETEFDKSEVVLSSSAFSPTKLIQIDQIPQEEVNVIYNQNVINPKEETFKDQNNEIPKEEILIDMQDNRITKEEIINDNQKENIPKEDIVNDNQNEPIPKEDIDTILDEYHQNDEIVNDIQKDETVNDNQNAENDTHKKQSSSENSNFISFSSVHDSDIPQDVKQSLIIPENPPPIEIMPIFGSPDANIIPAEQMNLDVFESPGKHSTGNQDDKYKLNSSEIQNHIFESSGEPSILTNTKAQNDISSLSEHLEKEQNSSQNQKNGAEFNEINEKADSEVIDSPEKGYFNDLFKSPNNIHYNKLAIYSEALSPKHSSPYMLSKKGNQNSNESPSSHANNSASFLSSPYKRVRKQPKTAMAMLNRHFSHIEEEESSEQYRSSFSTLKTQSPPKDNTTQPVSQNDTENDVNTTFNDENSKNSTFSNDNDQQNSTVNIKNEESNHEIIEEEEIPEEEIKNNNDDVKNEKFSFDLNNIPTIPSQQTDIRIESQLQNENALNESKNSNINHVDYSTSEHESEISQRPEEKSEIDPGIQEAIDTHNFTPNIIRNLVHSIVGVPLYDKSNMNQNLSLAANRNSSIIEIEDRIFEFQERLCTVIEVELKKDNGEVISIFPTNLNTIHSQSKKTNEKSKEDNKSEKKNTSKLKSPSQPSKLPRSRSPNRSFNSPFKSSIRNKSVEKANLSPSSPASKQTSDKRSPSPISKIPKFPDSMSSSRRSSQLKSPLKNSKKRLSADSNEVQNIDHEKQQFNTIEPNLDDFVSVSTPAKTLFNENKQEDSNKDDFIPVSTPTKKSHIKSVSSIPTSPLRNKKSNKKNSLIGKSAKKEETPIDTTNQILEENEDIKNEMNSKRFENNSESEINNNSSELNESNHSESENKPNNEFDSDEFVSVSTPQKNSLKSKSPSNAKGSAKKEVNSTKNEFNQEKTKNSKPLAQSKSSKAKPVPSISSPARNKPSSTIHSSTNPFMKGKGNAPQFSLRKPLKRAIPSTTKKPQQEKETSTVIENEFDNNTENDEEINEIIQFPTGGSKEEKPTLANRNKKSSVKSSINKPNPAVPNNNKAGLNNKKIQLQSPKTIEDPFKALKAQNKKKNSIAKQQPAANKKKSLPGNTTSKKSSNNNQANTKAEKHKEDNNNSSILKSPFNIDMSMFADANQPKQQFNMQSSPSRKPRSLASVLIAADDYSDDDYED